MKDKSREDWQEDRLGGEVEVAAEFLCLSIRETSQMIKEKHSRFIKRKRKECFLK